MKYYKESKLKNGQEYILRSATAADAAAILEHLVVTSGETENMLRYPDEFHRPEEQEAKYLSELEASADAVMICAEVEGKIVACASCVPVARAEKCKHRAEFGISTRSAYWGLGIGSAIMEVLLQLSREAGYERLELDVVTDNERGIALYKKYGFEIYGTNPEAFRCRDGRYQALHLMSRKL